MTAPPAPTVAEQYPIRGVRFVNGRTRHRTRRPDNNRWWDLLHAACGKTGYKTDAYTFGTIRDCRGCAQAIASNNQKAA
ncbi:hypothetical protein ADK57_25865 [Streptomyces sp. MMG1533]|uniref:hypothetical protein n=1 Tax=Streptomyces sp. MMG1533 TaxID=1415546 RepID=UPI0006ADA359|nr:hypothetical protein [Streptomyces sp. MMG1533]KOU62064.1 hypothetical protein ADK57_25865 [Streptomyces sp. MMG1533]